MLSQKETEILRALGAAYMEIASLPVQREKLDLWKALNRCGMQRPMVVMDQLPWNELEQGEESLACQVADPYWREQECRLRRTLYQWRHFPVDMVVEPFFTIPLSADLSGWGVAPVVEKISLHENDISPAQHFEAVLAKMEDLEKIQTDQTVIVNEAENQRHLAEAEQIFAGILPVRLAHGITKPFPFGFHLGIWDTLTTMMGVENIYMDFIDRPEFLHAAMRRMTDSVLSSIRAMNEHRLHNDTANTCHCSYIYTDELLPDFGAGKGSTSQNAWAFGLAQIFTSVSPAFMEEFEFPYVSEMAQEFGMVYYGCCDRLDDRLDMVARIPHVRKVSCSPWSDREAFAEKIGRNLVMSNKPTPALLSGDSFDADAVRADLRRTCDAAKRNNVNVELILKDVSTVRFQPERLAQWGSVAMEVAQSY